MTKPNQNRKSRRVSTEVEFEHLLAQEMAKFDIANGSIQHDDPVTSKENVNKEGLQKGKRINLGDGLFLLIGRNGGKSFHYRISMNGNDTSGKIGNHPDTGLEEARKISDERKAQIASLKNKEKIRSLDAKIKEQKIRKKKVNTPCFARLSDAGKFYENILNGGITHLEFKVAALLILLVPTRYEDLIYSTKNSYNPNSKTISIRDCNLKISTEGFIFAVPDEIANMIDGMLAHSNYDQQSQLLFPKLSNMTQKEIDETITNIYMDGLTQNPITALSLRNFFAFAVENYGGFNNEFIKRLTKIRNRMNFDKERISFQNIRNEFSENLFYARQENAVINWYADQILRGCYAFDKSSILSERTDIKGYINKSTLNELKIPESI
jgi:hypothetical protein